MVNGVGENSLLDGGTSSVPGQGVLPELQEEMGYESIKLPVAQEKFCWEYVLRNENGRKAYMAAYPDSKPETADSAASRLLRSDKVKQRITQIKAELNRKYLLNAAAVMRYHGMVANIDRREYLDDDGKLKPLQDLDSEAAAIVDLEIHVTTTGHQSLVYRIPERLKSQVEMARMLGLHKDKFELTGKDGKPIQTESVVKIYIPDNGRD